MFYLLDSIMLVERNEEEILPRSSKIGGLKDELSEIGNGTHGTIFCSGGPKTYALKVVKPDGSFQWIFKVKGITLNYHNLTVLNPEQMLSTILYHPEDQIEVEDSNKFNRSKKTGLPWNRMHTKRWKIVYTKRIIVNHFDTLPFGYYQE